MPVERLDTKWYKIGDIKIVWKDICEGSIQKFSQIFLLASHPGNACRERGKLRKLIFGSLLPSAYRGQSNGRASISITRLDFKVMTSIWQPLLRFKLKEPKWEDAHLNRYCFISIQNSRWALANIASFLCMV